MNTAQLDQKFSRRLVAALRYDVGRDERGEYKWVSVDFALGLIRHGDPDMSQLNRVTSGDAQQPLRRQYFERKAERDEETGWVSYLIRARNR